MPPCVHLPARAGWLLAAAVLACCHGRQAAIASGPDYSAVVREASRSHECSHSVAQSLPQYAFVEVLRRFESSVRARESFDDVAFAAVEQQLIAGLLRAVHVGSEPSPSRFVREDGCINRFITCFEADGCFWQVEFRRESFPVAFSSWDEYEKQ